jgi:hypothetical protein
LTVNSLANHDKKAIPFAHPELNVFVEWKYIKETRGPKVSEGCCLLLYVEHLFFSQSWWILFFLFETTRARSNRVEKMQAGHFYYKNNYKNQTWNKNSKFWLLVSFWPLYILKSHKKLVSIIYKDNFLRNKKNKIHQDWEKNRCSTYNKRQHPCVLFFFSIKFHFYLS